MAADSLLLLPACAVGLKKRLGGGVDSRLMSLWSRKCGFVAFLPLLVRASRERLLPPTSLYRPPFALWLPPPPHVLFFSEPPRMLASAALRTERLMDQATRPRQSSTQAPRKASTAPTAMKTVPSGSVDFCMKGAPAV